MNATVTLATTAVPALMASMHTLALVLRDLMELIVKVSFKSLVSYSVVTFYDR